MVTIAALSTSRPGASRCPRCTGRVSPERDWHGAYLSCFTCGYTHEVLEGGALTDPDEALATVPTEQRAVRSGIDRAFHRPTGWRYIDAAATAVATRPYVAAPARRCERCQLRNWSWHADGPTQGTWCCSYCGGTR